MCSCICDTTKNICFIGLEAMLLTRLWFLAVMTKSSVWSGLCDAELEELFPYWDNMPRDL